MRPCEFGLTRLCSSFTLIEVLFELLKSSVMRTVVERIDELVQCYESLLPAFVSVQHPNPLWFLTCLWYFIATTFEYLFGVRDDLLLRSWPMPPTKLYIFHSLRPWLNGRTAGSRFGFPCGSNFVKACVEEWKLEVHRRAHELSSQEVFACLTRADPWDECDSPCEPHSAPKPTSNDWSIPNGLPSTPPGLPSTPQSSWQPYSNTNTTQNSWVFRRHVLGPPDEPATLKPVVPETVHPIQHGITPIRLLLSHSDTEILSHIDDDISSIRDGSSAWVTSDATQRRNATLACKGVALPAFRKANERRRNPFSPSEIPFRHQCAKPSARSEHGSAF